MNIYLVRHGQTIHNQGQIHQNSHTPLSELGKQQALQIAHRLIPAKIDKIYASPMVRAQETAQVIAQYSQMDITTLDDLREFKKPSIFEGKPHTDPALESIKKSIHENSHNPSWHHSDEENFSDIKARAERVLALMEQETEEDILLVTHSYFISVLTAAILLRENLNSGIFADFISRITLTNTGITHVIYEKSQGWRVRTLNDTTHLS